MSESMQDVLAVDLLDDLGGAEDEEECVLFVEAAMFPSDGGASYRTRNSKQNPFQRTTGTDRKGTVNIRLKLLDIVHGTLHPDEPTSFATLIVFKCVFFSKKHSRRVKSADIQLVFKTIGEATPDPEVVDIVPQGRFCLMPETEERTVTKEASGDLNVPLVGGMGGSAGLKWQQVKVRQGTKYTTVFGEIGTYGRDEGEDNGAGWSMLENPMTKDGVPHYLTGAILMKRHDNMSHFQCDLEVKVETDRWTALSGLFQSEPLDDPILFDPKLPSTDRLKVYTTDRLSQVKLSDFEDINIMNTKSGIVRDMEPVAMDVTE
ncbi:hypothetical protein FPANT_12593 [Fusarium pseudoanthophilum]|uniref:Uncharacterized protein n=1 Tax=Fusarium pseudoanthophilum TaxID=48495 RepID=A0A8H5KJH6_9HYPO|nr:hypothetical protein FPANT_12593 [Fusarium pseudoanthophilum]